MAELSDIVLVTQVVVFSNKRAFDRLVRKYQSPVRRFLLNLTLGDGPLSDDLAQETFIKAYLNIGSFRGASGFSTWLFRIAYNVHYDYRRKMKHEASAVSGDDLPAVIAASSFSPQDSLKMDIYQALSRLREAERTCVTLQLVDGLPIDEIARITALPQNTVKSHLRRGKEKLTDYLKRNGYDR